jgi:hypothetical protein
MKPLCIDLFCGLGGWTEGFLAEGYEVVGFDIERHVYGDLKYPSQLVLQDVLTIHGSQFRNAACIVASPPCQKYSWLAMPWSRSKSDHSQAAKALRREWETNGPDNRLFDACFRIQREACEAAGRFIPMVVENVRGAVEWVGPANWSYGSFYLWGDVPAIMPMQRGIKNNGGSWFNIGSPGQKETGKNPVHELAGLKVPSTDGGRRTAPGNGARFTSRDCGIERDGMKVGGDWFRGPKCHSRHGSKSSARKAASAQIAKIPFPLSNWIAQCFKPRATERVA